MKIQLDMYQTIAAAVLVLMLGKYLKRKCSILEKFCIPAPVIGGVIFAVFTCICYVTGIAEFSFDDILKDVCMVFFFTSVGFQANLKVLKSGGKALIVFLGLVIGLIFCQNFLAVGLAKLLQISPLVGLCTGSIPMVGGHGTAGAFGPILEDFGISLVLYFSMVLLSHGSPGLCKSIKDSRIQQHKCPPFHDIVFYAHYTSSLLRCQHNSTLLLLFWLEFSFCFCGFSLFSCESGKNMAYRVLGITAVFPFIRKNCCA